MIASREACCFRLSSDGLTVGNVDVLAPALVMAKGVFVRIAARPGSAGGGGLTVDIGATCEGFCVGLGTYRGCDCVRPGCVCEELFCFRAWSDFGTGLKFLLGFCSTSSLRFLPSFEASSTAYE